MSRIYGACRCADDGPLLEACVSVEAGRLRLALDGKWHHWRLDSSVFARLERALVTAAVDAFPGGVALHAASFVASRHLVLAVGPHGAGKSTLLRAAARAGARPLGDDVALVDGRGRPRALSRAILVKGGRLTPEEAADAVRRSGVCYLPPPATPKRTPRSIMLVFLHRDAGASDATLRPLGGRAAFRALLPHVFGLIAPLQTAALAALVRRAGSLVFVARYAEATALVEALVRPAQADRVSSRRRARSARASGARSASPARPCGPAPTATRRPSRT